MDLGLWWRDFPSGPVDAMERSLAQATANRRWEEEDGGSDSSSDSRSTPDTNASNAPLPCDRRLSRAAREIVRRDILPVVQPYADRLLVAPVEGGSGAATGLKAEVSGRRRPRDSGGNVGEYVPSATASELRDSALARVLDSLLLPPASDGDGKGPAGPYRRDSERWCPLDPRLDRLLDSESLTSALGGISVPIHGPDIAAATTVAGKGRGGGGGRRRRQTVHRCGICNKTFYGRYYLDLHLDAKHPAVPASSSGPRPIGSGEDDRGDGGPVGPIDSVCPADDLCPSLGGTYECERIALENEPHYGRGSGGAGFDRDAVRRSWAERCKSR